VNANERMNQDNGYLTAEWLPEPKTKDMADSVVIEWFSVELVFVCLNCKLRSTNLLDYYEVLNL